MASLDSAEPFRHGVLLFRQEKYLESLAKFDEAIAINDHDRKFYDTRAAALEKLGRYKEALRDSKKVVDLDPEWWQGYARSARLFLEIKRPSAALRMVDLALERIRNSDIERRSELVRLKERAQNEAQLVPLAAEATRPARTFLELPVEIIYEIICMFVGDTEARIFPLMLICRRFRDIILNTPMLWRRLTIGPKTTLKEASARISRACGSLSRLRILSGFDLYKLPSYLRSVPEDLWARLENLEISSMSEYTTLHRRLPEVAVKQMRLLSLKLSWIPGIMGADDPLLSLNLSRLTTIVYESDSVKSWESICSCTCLTTLHLKAFQMSHDHLYYLIAQNPSLETLTLVSKWSTANIPDGFGERSTIMLSNLHRLEIGLMDATNNYLHLVRFPNLESLRLMFGDYHGLSNPSFVDGLLAQPLVHLSELRFSRCRCKASSLVALLRALPKLERFSYTQCRETHVLNELLIALSPQANGEGGSAVGKNLQQQQTHYCPRLEYLNLTDSPDLLAGPLIQFTKCRLPTHIATTGGSSSSCSEGDRLSSTPMCVVDVEAIENPLPIKTLILNDCPRIEAEILPWLRLRVKYVEFAITRPSRLYSRRRQILL